MVHLFSLGLNCLEKRGWRGNLCQRVEGEEKAERERKTAKEMQRTGEKGSHKWAPGESKAGVKRGHGGSEASGFALWL